MAEHIGVEQAGQMGTGFRRKLQKAGLIERLPAELLRGRSVNRYSLAGLVRKLAHLAEKAVASRVRPRPEAFEDSG